MCSLLYEFTHNSIWRCITCYKNTSVEYCIGDSNNNIYWRCNTCIVDIDIDYTKINIYIEAVTAYNNSHYTYYDRGMVMGQHQPHNSIFKDPGIIRSAIDAFTLTKI